MEQNRFQWYEQWLKDHEDRKHTRHEGGYWHYLDRWLHDKEAIVDGADWEFRMKYRTPMAFNTYCFE